MKCIKIRQVVGCCLFSHVLLPDCYQTRTESCVFSDLGRRALYRSCLNPELFYLVRCGVNSFLVDCFCIYLAIMVQPTLLLSIRFINS